MSDRQLQYAPSGDPIHAYTFDNVSGSTVYDEIGSEDLTISANYSIGSSGKINDCVTCGSDGLAKAEPSTNITWTSLSLWAKFTASGSDEYNFVQLSSGNVLLTRNTDNTLEVVNSLSVGHSIADTAWHHYVFVKDVSENELLVYIDNVLEATLSFTATMADTIDYFGNSVGVVGYRAPDLDIIHVYDYELSSTDIESLYILEGLRVGLPLFEVEAEGTFAVIGGADITLPLFEVDYSAEYNIDADSDITLPLFEVEAVAGKSASLEFELPLFQVAATTGARAGIELPLFDVSAITALPEKKGDFEVSLPLFTISMGGDCHNVGNADISLPLFALNSSGHSISKLDAEISLPLFIVDMSASGGTDIVIELPLFEINMTFQSNISYGTIQYIRGQVR